MTKSPSKRTSSDASWTRAKTALGVLMLTLVLATYQYLVGRPIFFASILLVGAILQGFSIGDGQESHITTTNDLDSVADSGQRGLTVKDG